MPKLKNNVSSHHLFTRLYFRAASVSQQNWAESTEGFHVPPLLTQVQPPHCQQLTPSYNSWTQTNLSPSTSIVYIGFPLAVVYSKGFDKSVICPPLIHHYHITQSGFIPLNGLCAPLTCPSLPWTLGNHWSFSHLYSFAFLRMLHSWNRAVFSLSRLISLTWQYVFQFLPCLLTSVVI